MANIGGHITGEIQKKPTVITEIGERIPTWETVKAIQGWLDLSNGDSKYNSFNAKIQESTHVFVADWEPLTVTANTSRMSINGKFYDVMLMDNPMEMNRQWEIYLKYTGV